MSGNADGSCSGCACFAVRRPDSRRVVGWTFTLYLSCDLISDVVAEPPSAIVAIVNDGSCTAAARLFAVVYSCCCSIRGVCLLLSSRAVQLFPPVLYSSSLTSINYSPPSRLFKASPQAYSIQSNSEYEATPLYPCRGRHPLLR